jgi:hypothetical protein
MEQFARYTLLEEKKRSRNSFAKAFSLDPVAYNSWNSFKVYVKENPEEFK